MSKKGRYAVQFLSSLLLPFVEGYWVTLAAIKVLPPMQNHTYHIMEKKV
jgi:hypothetical protein